MAQKRHVPTNERTREGRVVGGVVSTGYVASRTGRVLFTDTGMRGPAGATSCLVGRSTYGMGELLALGIHAAAGKHNVLRFG